MINGSDIKCVGSNRNIIIKNEPSKMLLIVLRL